MAVLSLFGYTCIASWKMFFSPNVLVLLVSFGLFPSLLSFAHWILVEKASSAHRFGSFLMRYRRPRCKCQSVYTTLQSYALPTAPSATPPFPSSSWNTGFQKILAFPVGFSTRSLVCLYGNAGESAQSVFCPARPHMNTGDPEVFQGSPQTSILCSACRH